MSVSAVIKISIAATETLTTTESPLIDSTDASIKEKIAVDLTLNGSSTPDAEMHAAMQVAMVAGAATIDFTALTRHGGGAVSFSGKNVRSVVLQNPATNANDITINVGAANGLALFGAASKVVLKPGDVIGAYFGATGPAVAAGTKNIDITGTGTQVLNLIAVAG